MKEKDINKIVMQNLFEDIKLENEHNFLPSESDFSIAQTISNVLLQMKQNGITIEEFMEFLNEEYSL
jgi:ATP-dependent helicase/DNAse subunit B